MFSFTSVLAAASALIATANAYTAGSGFGFIAIDSGAPVHLQSLVVRDNKVYLGGGDNVTYLTGDIAAYDGKSTGFAVSSFPDGAKWLTVQSDGHLAYESVSSDGTVVGDYDGWRWTSDSVPHLAYLADEGGFACEVSSGEYQVYFQIEGRSVSCPSGETEYRIVLRRV